MRKNYSTVLSVLFLLVYLSVFNSKLSARLLNYYQDQDICNISTLNEVNCYGEYNSTESVTSFLTNKDILSLEYKDNVNLFLIGFININKDINAITNLHKTLIIGSETDEDYENSYFKGNNTNIRGIHTVILNSWGKASLGGFTFYDLGNLVLKENNAEYSLDNINFINHNNFTANINGQVIELTNVVFNMLSNSILDLTINVGKNNISTLITGNAVVIKGDSNSIAKINILGENLSKLALYGIESSLSVNFNIENTSLTIKKDIKFKADNNNFKASNTIVNGNITFFKNNNNLTLDNVNVSNGNSINLYKNNNTLNIKNRFSGTINLIGENNKLNLISANLNNAEINLNKTFNLFSSNSIFDKDTTLYFSNGQGNNITFGNSSYYGRLVFKNNEQASITFQKDTNNYFGANLDIDATSQLDINVEKNAKVKLNFTSNKFINRINIYNNSTLELINSTVNINNLNQEGDANINVNLQNTKAPAIYAKQTDFKNGSIFVNTYNNTLLKDAGNTVSFDLLQSDNVIKDLNKVKLSSNLFDYKVVYNENKITIILKKTKDIVNLVKEYYNPKYSVFYKTNLINIANYLDNLWDKDNAEYSTDILDYLSNISDSSKNMLEYLTSLFPITNNILNNAMQVNLFNFTDQIINNSDVFNKSIWYDFSFINTNFNFQNNGRSDFNGRSISLGKSSVINQYFSVFNGLDFTYSNSGNYSNNIDLFGFYGSSSLKACLTYNLCSINTVDLGLNYFYNNRYVVTDSDYNYSNKSTPFAINYLINSSLKYTIDIFNNNVINYKLIPVFSIGLGRTILNNYKETGKQALQVNGFSKNFYRTEFGISSLVSFKLKNIIINSNADLIMEHDNNKVDETNFKLRYSNIDANTKVTEYLPINNYVNYKFKIGCTNLSKLVEANLSLVYKINKRMTSTVVSVSGVLKF